MEFELVIPCYNEAAHLEELIASVVAAAKENYYTHANFRLVLVNNGSADDSAHILAKIQNTESGVWLRIVNIAENKGYGYGLWQGLHTSTAQYIGWLHADLQFSPAYAFQALALLKQKSTHEKHLVKGKRHSRSIIETLQTLAIDIIASCALRTMLRDIGALPKVMPRAMLDSIEPPPAGFEIELYLLFCARKLGYTIDTIPVTVLPRRHGTSSWSNGITKRCRHAMKYIGYIFELRKQTKEAPAV